MAGSDSETDLSVLSSSGDEGLDDGYDGLLPPFANASNRALDAEVKHKSTRVVAVAGEIETTEARVGVLKSHLSNVEEEISHTEALLEAKRREIETEKHLRVMATAEFERVTGDSKATDKALETSRERLNVLQNATFRANETLEQFRQDMEWNQEELLQWSLAAKQKAEDQEALELYQQQDDTRIKQLTLQLERASQALQERKAELATELTETQAVQIELDKTAEDYRALHESRQELIRQWDDAKRAMQRRDREIAAAGETIQTLKDEIGDLDEQLREQDALLETHRSNNAQAKVELGQAERQAEQTRGQLHRSTQGINELRDEVYAMRNELSKATSDVRTSKAAVEHLRASLEERHAELDALTRAADAAEARLAREQEHTLDLEQQAKQVDELHAEHEATLAATERELQRMKEHMFKESRKLFELRKAEADLIADISSAQSSARNLQARINDLDQRSLKQQEMLYTIDFKVQQLERKVARAAGKRTIEETTELNERIAALKEALETQTQQVNMLNGQVRRLDEEVRATDRSHKELLEKIGATEEEIGRFAMDNKSAEEQLAAVTTRKEEMVVQHDSLKLQLKRLRYQLDADADAVIGLQNRKLQLELGMTERQQEIQAEHEILRAEIKVAEEARHMIARDARERQVKLSKLEAKFATVAGKTPVVEGAEGDAGVDGERSQAFFIVAAAQKRAELQREGDELNAKIKRSEKEIKLLNKTLRHLTGRNKAYRESFQRADMEGPEAQMHARLEAQDKSATDTLFKKKSYLREAAQDQEERELFLAQLRQDQQALREEIERYDDELDELGRDGQQLEERLGRAKRDMSQAHKAFREKVGGGVEEHPEELLLKVRETRGRNETVLKLVRVFVEENPQLREVVEAALRERGVDIDDVGSGSRVGSRSGSRSGSRAGSRVGTPRGVY